MSAKVLKTDKTESVAKNTKKKKRFSVAAFIVCLVYVYIVLVPFYVIFVTSVTPLIEYGSSSSFVWFPQKPTFQAYVDLFTQDPMVLMIGVPSLLIGFGNTLWMAVFSCTVSVLVSGLAAYVYSKYSFKGKSVLFGIQITTIMIPTATLTIPSYVYYNAIGWGQGFAPLIVPIMFGGATAIYFLRSYMTSIPNEVIEAAKMDGLGLLGIYIKVIIPLSLPALVAQFIFSFVGMYNSYQGPLLYLYSNPRWYTLQLALNNVQSIFKNPNQQCASAIVALVPLIVIYVFLQRFFIEGISVGGGKE